ncbi:uncharacterized protein EI97DRAFT_451636 [Westerdykella ornata]|uniref:Uncharacterized protein n=1 Tax=Westerdykella ornata TaxID=318751 RepID=A0A6A6JDQ3_WESOR|nr:uncharacterized protein EI97DRAFT_451636 [Westerdykella ornata]KAF2274552.1 hypothetical protein EI97DRAFT_451636 [Westerdykella ornata]
MLDKKAWIILAAVLGTLVLLLVLTLVLFFWKRSKRRLRGFSLRAVTPLDDAEFESWRRPSQYTRRPEKTSMRTTPAVTVRTTRTPAILEKDINSYELPRDPSPLPTTKASPISPIRKPERVRRKSSVSSSIADRPPTPYSPTSPSADFPRRSSHTSRKSGSTPYPHYPLMSEASTFDFKFDPEHHTGL